MSSNKLNNCFKTSNYTIEVKSNIPSEYRANDPNTSMPQNPKNGGIYGGNSSKEPWMPISITPTATNYIKNNLKSANPPPGATEQYIGTNRLGNNYTSMPEIYWFDDGHWRSKGPFNLKVTK